MPTLQEQVEQAVADIGAARDLARDDTGKLNAVVTGPARGERSIVNLGEGASAKTLQRTLAELASTAGLVNLDWSNAAPLPLSLIDAAISGGVKTPGDISITLKPVPDPGHLFLNGETFGDVGTGAAHEIASGEEAFNVIRTWAPNLGTEEWGTDTVTLPNLTGASLAIVEALGGVAAVNRLQRSTRIDTVSGRNTATVADVSGIAIGMHVFSADIPEGARSPISAAER